MSPGGLPPLQVEMKSVRLKQTQSVFLNTKQMAEGQRWLPEERPRKQHQSWILKLCRSGLITLLLMDLGRAQTSELPVVMTLFKLFWEILPFCVTDGTVFTANRISWRRAFRQGRGRARRPRKAAVFS